MLFSLPHVVERCQQSINIVDLGLGFTSKYIECILAMHSRLAAYIHPASLDPWNIPQNDGRDIELFFGNRYFSDIKNPRIFRPFLSPLILIHNSSFPPSRPTSFTQRTMWLDVLKKSHPRIPQHRKFTTFYFFSSQHLLFIHSTIRSISCSAVSPCDLVEIQIAFSLIKHGKNKYRMLIKLRSVCVLDRTAENVWC